MFLGEVKTLMIQLLRGVRHLHDNWILHRDLKTSNLLLSHKGILKVSYDGFFYLQEIWLKCGELMLTNTFTFNVEGMLTSD